MKYRILDIHPEDAHENLREQLIGCIAVPVDSFHVSFVNEDGKNWMAGEFEVLPDVLDDHTFYFHAVELEEVEE